MRPMCSPMMSKDKDQTKSSVRQQRQARRRTMPGTTSSQGIPQPSGSGQPFSVGDAVVVKGYGQAQVVQQLQADGSQPFAGRVQVQYPDGKLYWARPEALRRMTLLHKRIIVAETTKQYREAAFTYVTPNDVCLEVGCHEGVTTAMLHGRCRLVVGVDLSDKTVQAARHKFPHVRFETVDGFDLEALQALSPTGEFDKIMVDIGGIAELPAVMQLVGLYYRTWRKSKVIVKSVFFARLVEETGIYAPSDACRSSAVTKAAEERERIRQWRELQAAAAPPQAAQNADDPRKERPQDEMKQYE